MSDQPNQSDGTGPAGGGFSRFAAFGKSLQASAQELSAKAAAQVDAVQKRNKTDALADEVTETTARVESSAVAAPSTPTISLAALQSENVTKAELLDILQKMNKKVKVLTAVRQQLTTQMEAEKASKASLVALVQEEMLQQLDGSSRVAADDPNLLPQLQSAWRAAEEQNALTLQTLQSEFQRVQQEQQGASSESWEAQKRVLEETHLQQLEQLKESMSKHHREELEKLSANTGSSSSSSTPPPDEIQRIKEAAAAQLQAFKKKVASARTAELQKVKTELAQLAHVELEKKLAEQAARHSTELERLQQEKQQASTRSGVEDSEKVRLELESLKAQHTLELQSIKSEAEATRSIAIEQARQEVEQAVTTEMEERLQEQLGSIRIAHERELESARAALLQQVQDAGTSQTFVQETTLAYENQIAELQSELASGKDTHTVELARVQDQLAATLAEEKLQLRNDSEKTLADLAAQKNAELEALKSEMIASQKSEREQLTAQLDQEKQRMQAEFDQKMLESIQNARSSANSDQDQALSALKQELESRLEKERIQWKECKEADTKELQDKFLINWEEKERQLLRSQEVALADVAAQKNAELELVREETLRDQQIERDQLLAEFEKERYQLQAELDKKVRESIEQTQSSDNAEKEEAVAALRRDFEAKLQEERDLMAKTKLEEIEKVHREAASNLVAKERKLAGDRDASLQELAAKRDTELSMFKEEMETKQRSEIERISSQFEREKQELQSNMDQTLKDAIDQTRSDISNDHERTIARLHNEFEAQLKQGRVSVEKEKDLELKRVRDEASASIERKEKELSEAIEAAVLKANAEKNAELGKLKEDLVAAQQAEHDKLGAAIVTEIEQKSAETIKELHSKVLAANTKAKSMESEEVILKGKIDELQHRVAAQEREYASLKASHEHEICLLESELKATAPKEIEKLVSEACMAVEAEKDEKISELKADYEEKLKSAFQRESEFVEKLNKVKGVHAQKMKNLEDQMQEKATALEKEKFVAQEAAKTAQSMNVETSNEFDKVKSQLEGQILEQKEQHEVDREAFESQLATLQSKLDKARRELEESKSAGADIDVEQEIADRVRFVEKTHEEEMKRLRSMNDDAISKLSSDNEEMRLKMTSEAEKNLETQAAQLSQKHIVEMEELRQKMAAHVDDMELRFKEKLAVTKERYDSEISQLKQADSQKDEKVSKLVEKLKSLSASLTSLRDEKEDMKAKLTSETATVKRLREDLRNTSESGSNTATELLQQQEQLEGEKKILEQQVTRIKSDLDSKVNEVEELTGKLSALSSNLSAMVEERKVQDQQLQEASRQQARLKASEAEVSELRELITNLKLDLTKSSNVVSRLQAEKDTKDRSHGQRTALVGMLEAQLSDINDKNAEINAKLEAALYDLSQKDESIQIQSDHVTKLEREAEVARDSIRKANESLALAQKGSDSRSTKMVESLQKELQTTKQQMAKKSSAAQRLLQEREVECAELRRTNHTLQQEVDQGSLSDRRIFELAAKQSNRESQQVSEIEIRDAIIERMKSKLLDNDGDLATHEKELQEVQTQLEELCRIKRREDVNLDYLKSIVVQYLSLPPGSSERAGLLPVLATLLQFNDTDYRTIEEGKNKLSWWGSVAPTVIGSLGEASTTLPQPFSPVSSRPTGGSAEVSVSADGSRPSTRENGKRTSLQF